MRTAERETVFNTVDELKQNGWKQYPSAEPRLILYKTFEGHEECAWIINGKHKQVEIYLYHIELPDLRTSYQFDVEVRGELPDGEWVYFACRGLSAKTPMGKLEAKASELLAAWDFAVKHNRDRLIQAQ